LMSTSSSAMLSVLVAIFGPFIYTSILYRYCINMSSTTGRLKDYGA
jgi:hypothetical protein